ncbi:helix-turn-helix domain-containing protein [Brenneria alni]|uniref:helix-turn-helix domain-containing protein n=1 Tax=Brenneria alni TaxID=71656 RepID=UPI00196B6800|nr:LexA family transcriptional regulator [Brenneria alni]
MINRWMSPKEIAAIPGMPKSIQGVHKKAKRDGWECRKREGVQGPGLEYFVPVDDLSSTIDKPKPEDNNAEFQFLDEFALVPGYRVQVSAGYGSLNDTGLSPCRYLAFRRKWLSYRGFNERDLVIVWAKGDSMEPTIGNNNTLLINTARKKPVDGNMYVIRQEDMLWVKRIQTQPNGALLLISDNTAYPPMEIRRDELHNFEVIGQVVHIAKDVGD